MGIMASRESEEAAPAFFPEWAKQAKHLSIVGMICCGLLIALCLFIFIPLAVTMYQTDGNCFLYADTYGFGAGSICEYCIAVAVILLILCAVRLALLVYKFMALPKKFVIDTAYKWFSMYGVHLAIIFLDVFLLLLLLVMACLISVGTAHLCNSLFDSRSKCSESDGVILPSERVNRSFYTALTISEASSWIGFIFWLIVVIFEVFVAWKKDTFLPIQTKLGIGAPQSTTV